MFDARLFLAVKDTVFADVIHRPMRLHVLAFAANPSLTLQFCFVVARSSYSAVTLLILLLESLVVIPFKIGHLLLEFISLCFHLIGPLIPQHCSGIVGMLALTSSTSSFPICQSYGPSLNRSCFSSTNPFLPQNLFVSLLDEGAFREH